jgi:hypothetical protein
MQKFHNLEEITSDVQKNPLNYTEELGLKLAILSGYQSKILEINKGFVVFFDGEREIIDTGEITEYDGDQVFIKRSDGKVMCWPVG